MRIVSPLYRSQLVSDTNSAISMHEDLRETPRFIAVEGPIGSGKTILAKKLAETFNYDTLLEQVEQNPFLEQFYQNRKQVALATQLFFLFQRSQQIQKLRQSDLFHPVKVADFLIDKDRLFAEINLNEDELNLYDNVYQQLTIDAPPPDLVIYLQVPVDTLLQRIQNRGIPAERHIDQHYLEQLNEAYSSFFLSYDAAPTLIVNAAAIDFIDNEQEYLNLVDYMLNIRNGRHYYNPTFFK
jgi:deoxyadenosine/deoxycytidine kinase